MHSSNRVKQVIQLSYKGLINFSLNADTNVQVEEYLFSLVIHSGYSMWSNETTFLQHPGATHSTRYYNVRIQLKMGNTKQLSAHVHDRELCNAITKS